MEVINHIIMINGQAYIQRKPHLKAKMVARMYVWENQPIDQVMNHYELSASEVHSAIAYYYDNQELLDAEYEQAVAMAEDNVMTLDKLKRKITERQAKSGNEIDE